jgi:hypothetical protein
VATLRRSARLQPSDGLRIATCPPWLIVVHRDSRPTAIAAFSVFS